MTEEQKDEIGRILKDTRLLLWVDGATLGLMALVLLIVVFGR